MISEDSDKAEESEKSRSEENTSGSGQKRKRLPPLKSFISALYDDISLGDDDGVERASHIQGSLFSFSQ
jgi:hypothetical protein